MERNSLNEALKRRASQVERKNDSEETALDDARRVKVLSPSRLVVKRFFRNRLAMIGLVILIIIFLFAFAGPLFYDYGETQVFMHYTKMPRPYAYATFNKTFNSRKIADAPVELPSTMIGKSNSRIENMITHDAKYSTFSDSKNLDYSGYLLNKLDDNVYYWTALTDAKDGSYSSSHVVAESVPKKPAGKDPITTDGEPIDVALLEAARTNAAKLKGQVRSVDFEFEGAMYSAVKVDNIAFNIVMLSSKLELKNGQVTPEMVEAADQAIANDVNAWQGADGTVYAMKLNEEGSYDIEIVQESQPLHVLTRYTFNMTTASTKLDYDVEVAALLNMTSGKSFTVNGQTYSVDSEAGELKDSTGAVIALISDIKVVDGAAYDSFDVGFKNHLGTVMSGMRENNRKDGSFEWELKQKEVKKDDEGKEELVDKVDKNGQPIFAVEKLAITEDQGNYTVSRDVDFYVTDKFAPMSSDHPFGTDGNGMDILARMMYGGRISLMVGFVVVIISMLIGVVLGGIAGYFGGWVDTLIMRLVEIFYCIPSYPILIILGGYMDAMRMPAKYRLYVMMAVLGLLGWAGIARLVRGQILSLREQEFMVASESTGIKVRHRIFRHLIPNVMPQLIVSATGSLGGVILTESSLSFLGLGVKFPLATWGNMIEFVTSLNENLGRYIYIWLPVGILICLTVISFNFVGDGLRDAFDPKMKR